MNKILEHLNKHPKDTKRVIGITDKKLRKLIENAQIIADINEVNPPLTPPQGGKSEVVFVTGIRAPLQKRFALKGGVLDPIMFDKKAEAAQKNQGLIQPGGGRKKCLKVDDKILLTLYYLPNYSV